MDYNNINYAETSSYEKSEPTVNSGVEFITDFWVCVIS
jgi:hypothetical protein